MTSFGQMDALNVAQFHQQIEGAINSRQAQMGILGFGFAIDFGRRQMLIGLRENVEYGLARPREFTVILAQACADSSIDRHRHILLNENDFQLRSRVYSE